MLYFAFIHSQMAYGIAVYGNTFSSYLNNKILRILQNAPRETHVADLYITFNTYSFQCQRQWCYSVLEEDFELQFWLNCQPCRSAVYLSGSGFTPKLAGLSSRS